MSASTPIPQADINRAMDDAVIRIVEVLVPPHDAFSRTAQQSEITNRSPSQSPPRQFPNLPVPRGPYESYEDMPSRGSPEREGITFTRPAGSRPYHRVRPPAYDATLQVASPSQAWAYAGPVAPNYYVNTQSGFNNVGAPPQPGFNNAPPQPVQGSAYSHVQGPAGYAQSPAQFVQGSGHPAQYYGPPLPEYYNDQGLTPPWNYTGQ
ncbi:uncharacterized protein LACBIDRAFT_328746 [Laccaria bicolor S238N-H82]|uniref:Predicted protein n=1 Tax=Laccaria bicolor (strain S238N-H82 / ATCC MYA-4686) TaxID=486041 RepID=B0DFV5_LACBS|nr:uncharacterized protein LACBIDRAFT_328746 [Laccaria bicolor S238N-H82]EDR06410.1 predicted protein [Laccaria bicolor S238N-H82]|eukprot:XP_001882782.1 predicted protein [Laccaria bicolor S238N-H82]